MDNTDSITWTGNESKPLAGSLEERLILVDRIRGLEAELAELRSQSRNSPSGQLSIERRLIAMQASFAWRLGRALTSPGAVLRRLRSR